MLSQAAPASRLRLLRLGGWVGVGEGFFLFADRLDMSEITTAACVAVVEIDEIDEIDRRR